MPDAAAQRLLSLPRRRALALTPLVDVIFLLLLFFMLASSFVRQAELELTTASAGSAAEATRPLFLQLGPESLTLNGAPVALSELATHLSAGAGETLAAPVLISLRPGVEAQRLVDLLVILRAAGHSAKVLE